MQIKATRRYQGTAIELVKYKTAANLSIYIESSRTAGESE